MERVEFYPFSETEQEKLQYAVIVAIHQGRWIFVKHRDRNTLEIAGGHREPGEPILQTAARELREETGASRFQLVPISCYQVTSTTRTSHGLLAFASVEELGTLPPLEIERIELMDKIPEALTYPTIQPILFAEAKRQMGLFSRLRNYEHVIFDWNGTLFDDVQLSVEVIGALMRKHQLAPVDLKQYRDVFGFPVIQYYQKLGFDFTRHTFHAVGDEFIAAYRERSQQARLFDGAVPVLKLLSKSGVQLSILSAASQQHLDEIVRQHGIHSYFSYIYGIDNHYAASKLERGRELLANPAVSGKRTLLVGDTDHDLEVGKTLGIDVLLVADGHQSFERLRQLHPKAEVMRSRFLPDSDS